MRLSDIAPLREDQDEPIFVSMLRRLLDAGEEVVSQSEYSGRYYVTGIKYNPSFDTYDMEAYTVGDDGDDQKDEIGLTSQEAERSKLVKRNGVWYIETQQGVKEGEDWPIWATIIESGLIKGRPFYFGAGIQQIINVVLQDGLGGKSVILKLQHPLRQNFGHPAIQFYTVWAKTFDRWTLKKHEDGHVLRMRQGVAEEKREEPLIITIMKKRLEKMGAIKFGVTLLGHGKKPPGWIKSIEHDPGVLLGSRDGWKVLIQRTTGKKEVFWLDSDADELYTLKTVTDDHGKYVELVER